MEICETQLREWANDFKIGSDCIWTNERGINGIIKTFWSSLNILKGRQEVLKYSGFSHLCTPKVSPKFAPFAFYANQRAGYPLNSLISRD
jgi:hypothetical protein